MGSGKLELHVGCGTIYYPGMVNIDLFANDARGEETRGKVKLDLEYDMSKLDEVYAENTVDRVFSYHSFEHLSKYVRQRALESWLKILKPCGCIEIFVPDALKICRGVAGCLTEDDLKSPEPKSREWFYFLLEGTQEFEGEHHLCHYDFDRLKSIVESVGYVDIEELPSQIPWREFGLRASRRDS